MLKRDRESWIWSIREWRPRIIAVSCGRGTFDFEIDFGVIHFGLKCANYLFGIGITISRKW